MSAAADPKTPTAESERARDEVLALERQIGMQAIRILGLEVMVAALTAERDDLASRVAAQP